MQLGVALTWPDQPEEIEAALSQLVAIAEGAGVDSLWTADHFFQIPVSGKPAEAPMLEAYATLAFLAGRTSRIRLGTLVTSVTYRHPGPLIKLVSSLDLLSGGRFTFGVGAGWYQAEADALGIPFPPLGVRFQQLEELLQIAHRMWSDDRSPFAGRHFQLGAPVNSPNSPQRPHPPILIGGGGERRTLRLVAEYGDACNFFDIPGWRDPELERKLAVLREHCRAVGRDCREIERTTTTFFDLGQGGPADQSRLLEHLAALGDLGFSLAILGGEWTEATLESVGSLVNRIHEIPVREEIAS